VLAQWRLEQGRWLAMPPGPNLAPHGGVRQQDGVVQLGLRKPEIERVARRLEQLLELVDDGRVGILEKEQP
jgi:hypothetical protein